MDEVKKAVIPFAWRCIGNVLGKSLIGAVNDVHAACGFVTTQGYGKPQDIKGTKRLVITVITGRIAAIITREHVDNETFAAALKRTGATPGPWSFLSGVSHVGQLCQLGQPVSTVFRRGLSDLENTIGDAGGSERAARYQPHSAGHRPAQSAFRAQCHPRSPERRSRHPACGIPEARCRGQLHPGVGALWCAQDRCRRPVFADRALPAGPARPRLGLQRRRLCPLTAFATATFGPTPSSRPRYQSQPSAITARTSCSPPTRSTPRIRICSPTPASDAISLMQRMSAAPASVSGSATTSAASISTGRLLVPWPGVACSRG